MSLFLATSTGTTDSVYHTLIKHISSKLDIVLVSWDENFIFNEELFKVKDYCLICFCEGGWDLELIDSHIWGINSEKFPRYYNNDWVKFDNWVKENPPKMIFVRELLKKDVSEKVQPIEYPCIVDKWVTQTKEEFNSRPINAFQYWGRSNEHRLRVHGEIWLHAFKKGFSVCDNLYYITEFLKQEQGEKWATLCIPHWARVNINQLMPFNNLSKLSLSWTGAGNKCFRDAEAPVNSVMVKYKNGIVYSFDWNETNCILVEPGKEIEGIEKALSNPYLHEIYLNGIQNCDKYRLENYIPFIEDIIKTHG